ncbi:MAG: BON domain-containing protein [Acidobacteria bacterium]|nr:BON domain-containing protein [Acidobacteriota bacterium]
MIAANRRLILLISMSILVFGLAGTAVASDSGAKDPAGTNRQAQSLAEQVRYKVITLPFLSVFDNINFTVQDENTVVLGGEVLRPTLKTDAEAVVRGMPGVKEVVNNIEVMPFSLYDDSIRLKTYRAIYLRDGFEKYAVQALLPIRIIVKNGNITLEGFVGTEMDKKLAAMSARLVPGAFSVTDNLKIG